jgi:membrane protease YdiL (CAAX protease family)
MTAERAAPEPLVPPPGWARPPGQIALATAAVTALVTALSWLLPVKYAATGVGFGFLGATWWLALRGDDEARVRAFGLSLGGLFELEPLEAGRVARAAARAAAWAAAVCAVIFPPFVAGYRLYWHLGGFFHLAAPPHLLDDVSGQLVVIALPEEAFFRGYLQSSLDALWPPRVRLLGALVGPSLVVTSAIFAAGHVLTDPHPARLAVFFPSLLFGWLRARTGGIGPGVLVHAACNLFVQVLGRGYGLGA